MTGRKLLPLLAALAAVWCRGEGAPAWIELSNTNGYAWVSTEVDAPIASDRTYKIQILPGEMKGAWLLQRPVAVMAHNVTNLVQVTRPARLYAAVLYKYIGTEKFTDAHFTELEQQGWTFVEDEYKTTTFQSEHWDWQVLRKDIEPGPVTFRSHSAMVVLHVREKPSS